jgi:hypothetical protein
MRIKLALISCVMALGLGVAAADIRIDPSDLPKPTEPPRTPPTGKKSGCSAREMNPEWMFGLVILGLGSYGLRRFGRRATPVRA